MAVIYNYSGGFDAPAVYVNDQYGNIMYYKELPIPTGDQMKKYICIEESGYKKDIEGTMIPIIDGFRYKYTIDYSTFVKEPVIDILADLLNFQKDYRYAENIFLVPHIDLWYDTDNIVFDMDLKELELYLTMARENAAGMKGLILKFMSRKRISTIVLQSRNRIPYFGNLNFRVINLL